jgi:alpha-tubulin suppressor-like RCC1 family protein
MFVPQAQRVELPTRVANTQYLPVVGDQGGLGTCAAFAVFYYAKTYEEAREHGWIRPDPAVNPERVASPAFGLRATSKGTSRSGLVGINHFSAAGILVDKGCAPWSVTPYSDAIDPGLWPTEAEWRAAMPWRSQAFGRVPDIHTATGLRLFKEYLARGNVAVVTMRVHTTLDNYPGWMGDDNGVYYTDAGTPWRDGHALAVIGYDDELTYYDAERQEIRTGALLAVNSWGPAWGVEEPSAGSKGFIRIAYDYVTAGNIDGNAALVLSDRLAYEPRLWAKATFSHSQPRLFSLGVLGDLSSRLHQPGWQQQALAETSLMNAAVSTTILTDLTDYLDLPTWNVTLSALDMVGVVDLVFGRQPGNGLESFGLIAADGSEVWSADPPLVTGGSLAPTQARIDMFTADATALAGLHLREGGAAWGDVDGDSRPDLAVTGSHYPGGGGGPVAITRVYRQQADGSFVQAPITLPGTAHGEVAWADVDSDGRLDLLVAGEAGSRLFLSDGAAGLVDRGLDLPAAEARQAVVADLDLDGRPDLILASAQSTVVLWQTAAGAFVEAIRPLPALTDGAVAVADLDGDGWLDIAMVGSSAGTAVGMVWRNQSDRTFVAVDSGLPATRGGDLAFADWDADGWVDAAVCGREPFSPYGALRILHNRGDGTFAEVPGTFTPLSAARLAWADLDANGYPELVAVGREMVAGATTIEDAYVNHTLFIRRHGQEGFKQMEFPLPQVAGGDWRAPLLAVADVSGNGAPDLLVGGSAGAVNEADPAKIPALLIRNLSPTFPFVARVNQPPAAPSGLSGEALPAGGARLNWATATDPETPNAGLSYVLRLGTAPGAGDILSGVLPPGAAGTLPPAPLVLRDLPAGRLYWSVAAVDPAGAVSDWSPEASLALAAYTPTSVLLIEAEPAYAGAVVPGVGSHWSQRGVAVAITALPAPGFHFVGWTGAVADPTGAATTVALDHDTLIVARFEKNVESADLAWQRRTAAAAWSARGEFPLLSHNGRLWVLGGSEFGTLRNDVWSSTDGASWRRETAAAGWSPRCRHPGVVFAGRLWVLGGSTATGAAADVWSSADGVAWQYEGDAAWGARDQHAAAVHDGAIYVAAGWQAGGYPRDVWRSTDGRTWTELTGWAGWPRRTAPLLATFDGALWLLGGWVSEGQPYYANDVWRSVDGVSWERILAVAPWAGRSEASLVVLDNRMWVLGGRDASAWRNDVWSSTNGAEWVPGTAANWPARTWAGQVRHNNLVYVAGGNTRLNDVWSGSPKLPPTGRWALTLKTFHVPDGTVNPNQGGTTVPPPGRYTGFGSTPLALAAVPETGWQLAGWDGPVQSPTAATTALTPSGEMTVTARFVKSDTLGALLTLTAEPPEGGAIEPAGQSHWVTLGTRFTVQATPAFGWRFSHWTGPVEAPTATATSLTVTGASQVTAHFESEGFRPLATLTGGRSHSLILDQTGNLWVSGDNRYGQLGVALEVKSTNVLYALSPLSDVAAVAAGAEHSVALRRDGTVWTWGIGFSGQCGRALPAQAAVEVGPVADLPVVTAIAVGEAFTLALDNDGGVWGWGSAAYGELTTAAAMGYSRTPVRLVGANGLGSLDEIVALAAGSRHGLVLSATGQAYGWGHNDRGQLGDGSGLSRPYPVAIRGLAGVRLLAAGGSGGSGDAHSVAVLADGSVRAWGANTAGQLGDGTRSDRHVPVVVLGLTAVVQIACGTRHTVALDRQGRVWTWGSNTLGQLGGGSRDDRPQPQLVAGLPRIRAVGAGENTTLAAADDGAVYAWGQNDDGQAAAGEAADVLVPQALTGFDSEATAVTVTLSMSVGAGAGTAPGAGEYRGWLGATLPLQAQPGPRYAFQSWQGPVADAAAAETTVRLDGAVACRADFALQPGLDPHLHLVVRPAGAGCLEPAAATTEYPLGRTVALRATPNHRHTFAGWSGDVPESATQTVDVVMDRDRWIVADFAPLPFWTQPALAAATGHSLLLTAQSTVYAWGANTSGQLGRGTFESPALPALVRDPSGVDALTGVVGVAAGGEHSLALTADGEVRAWGSNQYGQCGQGVGGATPQALPLPAAVPEAEGSEGPLAGIRAIAAGAYFSAALDSAGAVWCWGRNHRGQLGLGDQSDRGAPTRVDGAGRSGPPPWVAVAAGQTFMLALDGDGGVWSWGGNDSGQLGQGGYAAVSLPTRVPGLTEVVAIAAGAAAYGESAFALRRDGTLWAWGGNHDGMLGNGTTEGAPVPAPVQGLSGVVALAVGHYHVAALDQEGQVWTWGAGYHGALGTGSLADALLPVRVAALPGPARQVAAGGAYTLAILANGDLYGWGYNEDDQLGQRYLPPRQSTPAALGLSAGDPTAVAVALTIRAWPTAAGTTRPASGVHWFPAGAVVAVEAIAEPNWRFTHWQGLVADPSASGTTAPMAGAHELTACFEPTPHVVRLGEVTGPPGGEVRLPLLLEPGAEPFAGLQAELLVPAPLHVYGLQLGPAFAADRFVLDGQRTGRPDGTAVRLLVFGTAPGLALPPPAEVLAWIRIGIAAGTPVGDYPVRFASGGLESADESPAILASAAGEYLVTAPECHAGGVRVECLQAPTVALRVRCAAHPSDRLGAAEFATYGTMPRVRLDRPYVVEIWLRDLGSAPVGFAAAALDIEFDETLLAVTALHHGVDFAGAVTGELGADRVTGFGGAAAVAAAAAAPGSEGWVRLGWLDLEALGPGQARIALATEDAWVARPDGTPYAALDVAWLDTPTLLEQDANRPPVAPDIDRLAVRRGGAVSISLPGSDPDGCDPLAFSIVTAPEHGTLTAGELPGYYLYTPVAGFVGEDNLTYRVSDGEFAAALGNVRLLVHLEFALSLRCGWNFISLPLRPLATSPAELLAPLASASAPRLWQWTGPGPGHGAYRLVSEVAPLVGYWLFVEGTEAPAPLVVAGLPVPGAVALRPGWQTVGPGAVVGGLSAPVVVCWRWTPTGLEPVRELVPGGGYWLFATGKGWLDVGVYDDAQR